MADPTREPVAQGNEEASPSGQHASPPQETGHDTPSDASVHSTGEKLVPAGSIDPTAKDPNALVSPDAPKDFEKSSIGKRVLVMSALAMAVFLAALDVTIVTTAIPTISEDFHSVSGYTWIGSAFLLANAASVPTWGKISDIFGRKYCLLLANVVFLVGSLVAALAHSIGMLIAARAVQGLGAGGLVILVNICIGDLFSLKNRGAYYGVIGGVWAIASAIGPIIGGAFTERVSWRWCFYINLPLDGLAFLIILFFLDLKTPKTPLWDGLKAIDWIGSLLVIGGTLMFLFGLEYGGTSDPWDSAIVLCLIIIGAFTFGLFLIYEWKFAKYPVMPLSIFSNISSKACFFIVLIHGFVFIAGSYYLPLYFQASLGASPIHSGVLFLPTCIALSITSIGTGIYIRTTGRFMDCIYFGYLMMTLGTGLLINYDANSNLAKIILYQAIVGFGIGPLFQAPLIALQSHINPRDMATATATFGFVRQIGTSVSVVIGGVVYQNQLLKKQQTLIDALGPQLGRTIANGGGANTQIITRLPEPGRSVAQQTFATSLQPMWIMYTAFSAVGLLATLLIRSKRLTADYTETKTGLEAEKERAAGRKADDEARRANKRNSTAAGAEPSGGDLEKANGHAPANGTATANAEHENPA